ncbi:MAG: CoA-binding protein [Dehalococcoidia bacterium]
MSTISIEAEILRTYHTIAVVGLSSDPSKPSNGVSQYMLNQGYRLIPVNPDEAEVFGLKAYPDLASVPEPVEFVNVFRRPRFCAEVAREAVAAGAKAIWLQSGIRSEEARRIAERAGLTYVEDRCVMVEHRHNAIGPVGQT